METFRMGLYALKEQKPLNDVKSVHNILNCWQWK